MTTTDVPTSKGGRKPGKDLLMATILGMGDEYGKRRIQRAGGAARLSAMSEEARALMIKLAGGMIEERAEEDNREA